MNEKQSRSIASSWPCIVVGCLVAHLAGGSIRSVAAPKESSDKYEKRLAEYQKSRGAFETASHDYWTQVANMRKGRSAKRAQNVALNVDDYVLSQPPVYQGPPEPKNPAGPERTLAPRPYVPVVADFLRCAKQEYNFSPSQPKTDLDFKAAYAKEATSAGLTADQAIRIYAFEATGNGTYLTQAGLEYNSGSGHAVTTALGYNQLLNANSVELLAEQGSQFISELKVKADAASESEKSRLLPKLAVLQQMIDQANSVPDDWARHVEFGNSPKGLGIHAMNLDIDVGPMLQTQKLMMSVAFARSHGYLATLSAAELEMMNLSGDGSGFDMVTMPREWRDRVPTSNFFQPSGYDDNPIVQRNDVVSKLINATNATMDEEQRKPGARALAAAFKR
jgi:hypothetical protein